MKNIINGILSQQDKLLHLFASGWIFLVLNHFIDSISVCFLITFLIGAIKEMYDWKYRNGADVYDVFANILGIMISMIVFIKL